MSTPSFVAPAGGSSAPKIKAGTYVARCFQMVMLGSHEETFQGETKPAAPRIRLGWEFPDELATFGEGKEPEPIVMGKEFKFSMHEKSSFRILLEGWRGAKFTNEEAYSFNAGKLLSVPCLINLIDYKKGDGSDGVKINTVSPLMKGQICPPLVNPLQALSLYPDQFDQDIFDTLPKFVQDKIKLSPEYQAIAGPADPVFNSSGDPTESLFGKEVEADQLPF